VEEDNNFIFAEMMKNDIIRAEFEKLQQAYGEEAFEENRNELVKFLKQGKLNLTYSV
jgi:hypothetical protein